MSHRVNKVLFLTVALFGVAAAPLQGFAQASQAPAPAAAPAGTVTSQSYDYRLGAADKVRVIVFGEPDLSGEFAVSGDGKVAMPLIGNIEAGGASASELQARIAAALSDGYLKNPRVSVEVLTFRPFYIMGEVQKPGEYPYSNGMTIERAVATASGYTYRANHKKVYIKHADSDKEEEYPLSSPVVIQPGDTIRVAERYF